MQHFWNMGTLISYDKSGALAMVCPRRALPSIECALLDVNYCSVLMFILGTKSVDCVFVADVPLPSSILVVGF